MSSPAASGQVRQAILTPCIGICSLDDQGLCEGCHRTTGEIAAWGTLSDDVRRWLMESVLPQREAERT